MKKPAITFALISIASAILYILLSIYWTNHWLVGDTLFTQHSLDYKINVLLGLVQGLPIVLPTFDLWVLLITASLTGINIGLLVWKLNNLRRIGKIKFILGGSMGLGLATTGCAVCTIPFWAFLGLGGSAISLPLEGKEFSLLTISLLLFSAVILLRDLSNKKQKCKT